MAENKDRYQTKKQSFSLEKDWFFVEYLFIFGCLLYIAALVN